MNFEVESRGLFNTQSEYDSLLNRMRSQGKHKKSMTRFQMVFVENPDFSADPDADVDLRLRVQNGKCLVVLKHGNWHSGETRKEYEIEIKAEDIEEQLDIFRLLGKAWGVSLFTETEFFEYKEAEVALIHLHQDIFYGR